MKWKLWWHQSLIFLRLLGVASQSPSPWTSSVSILAEGRGAPGLGSDKPQGLTFGWILIYGPYLQVTNLVSDFCCFEVPFFLPLFLPPFFPLSLPPFFSFILSHYWLFFPSPLFLSFLCIPFIGTEALRAAWKPASCVHLCYWEGTTSLWIWATNQVTAYHLLNVLLNLACSPVEHFVTLCSWDLGL